MMGSGARIAITKEAAALDFAMTEDQVRFKQAAREFLNKEVIPYRAEWDRRESVFDAIAASRSLVTFVGARNRVGWPGGLGLARLPIVGPVPLYPWSLVWRADTAHAGARRLVSHVKRTFEPPAAGAAVWLPRQARDDLR